MGQVKVVRPEDEKKTVYGAGDKYTFLATGDDTDGNDDEARQDIDRAVGLGFDRGIFEAAIDELKKQ